MPLIRYIARQFDPVYLKPTNLARALREIAPCRAPTPKSYQQSPRHRPDRRCGIDRRQTNKRVLIDMRSSYARRIRSGRREAEGDSLGLDIFA